MAPSYSAPPAVTLPPAVSDETAHPRTPTPLCCQEHLVVPQMNVFSAVGLFYPRVYVLFFCGFDSRPYTILVFPPTAGFAAVGADFGFYIITNIYIWWLWLISSPGWSHCDSHLLDSQLLKRAFKSQVTGHSAANVSLRNYVWQPHDICTKVVFHNFWGPWGGNASSKTSLTSADLSDLPFKAFCYVFISQFNQA